MRVLFLLLALCSFPALADICICQYPKEDARFGDGYQKEIGFYKMGCAFWLVREKNCRKQKIMDINTPLEPYLTKVLKGNEKVKVGYVGHWSSSKEYVDYLKTDIEPLLKALQTPIEIENTACLSMDNAEMVQNYLNTVPSTDNAYIRVEGTQTVSIGMWDKVLIHRRKADLIAFADSRQKTSVYPACKEFLRKNCTAFQDGESGYCTEKNGSISKLICHKDIKEKMNGDLKERRTRKWLYETDYVSLAQKLQVQVASHQRN